MEKKTLNNQQRQLVEDNYGLIYAYMSSHHLQENDVEDWFGTCAIGLCQAALAYDEDRNVKFTTLAYTCIENEVNKVFQKKRLENVISLDLESSSEEGSNLYNIIPDVSFSDRQIEFREMFNHHYNELCERDKGIINYCVHTSLSHVEIAKKYNVSRPVVDKVYNRFKNNIKESLFESRRNSD